MEKFKVGDIVYSKNTKGEAIKRFEWEVVDLHESNQFLVQVRELSTDYAPHWIDVSMLVKKES